MTSSIIIILIIIAIVIIVISCFFFWGGEAVRCGVPWYRVFLGVLRAQAYFIARFMFAEFLGFRV